MAGQDRFGIRDMAAPWYAGHLSFLRAPWVEPDKVPGGEIGIVGMPFDQFATVGGRSGMRWGPRRIREASLFTSTYHAIQSDDALLDYVSGQLVRWPAHLPLVDTGDVPMLPSNQEDQFEAAATHVRQAASTASMVVTLGGDHFATYPAVEGVCRAWRERKPDFKLGYLHIDSHLDFIDFHHEVGRLHHGCAARRISEIPNTHRVGWYGINFYSQPNQFHVMGEKGYRVATADLARRIGADRAMEQILDYVTDGVDVVYVSIDIDFVNGAHAPATGAATFQGVEAADALAAAKVIGKLDNLIGFDVCEVCPDIEGSYRTEHLAVELITTILHNRLFETAGTVDQPALRSIFLV